jgi:hypothetical protein
MAFGGAENPFIPYQRGWKPRPFKRDRLSPKPADNISCKEHP